MSTPTLELVRCGCGLVRNDEDRPCYALQQMAVPAVVNAGLSFNTGLKFAPTAYELPRVCRGCGCIYALPKQRPPTPAT